MNSAGLAVLIQSASLKRLGLFEIDLGTARVILGAVRGSASTQHVGLVDHSRLSLLALDASQVFDGFELESAEDTTLDVARPRLVRRIEVQVGIELAVRVDAELDSSAGQFVHNRLIVD